MGSMASDRRPIFDPFSEFETVAESRKMASNDG